MCETYKNSYLKFPILKNEKKSYILRKRVNHLFFGDHLSKPEIVRQLRVTRNFVIKWTKSPDMDLTVENRGWQKGKRRRRDNRTENRIKQTHSFLTAEANEFFSGATAVQQRWQKLFPQELPPPLRTIGQIMKDLALTKPYKRKNSKGAARYLCYPEQSIQTVMGKRVLELDFIGKKFIGNRTKPLNFIGFSFKQSPRLRYFERILGETGEEIIKYSGQFFGDFEKPGAIKMDNGFAMAGSAPHPGTLNKVPIWMPGQKVVPVYAVPRRPFTQASIEGNNSVFSRNFWNARHFKTVEQVDEQLPLFNKASAVYCGYEKPGIENLSKDFKPHVYFIRQVREINDKALIELAHQNFEIAKDYLNYFVFAKWDLIDETLSIFIEIDNHAELICTYPCLLNTKTKITLKKNDVI